MRFLLSFIFPDFYPPVSAAGCEYVVVVLVVIYAVNWHVMRFVREQVGRGVQRAAFVDDSFFRTDQEYQRILRVENHAAGVAFKFEKDPVGSGYGGALQIQRYDVRQAQFLQHQYPHSDPAIGRCRVEIHFSVLQILSPFDLDRRVSKMFLRLVSALTSQTIPLCLFTTELLWYWGSLQFTCTL